MADKVSIIGVGTAIGGGIGASIAISSGTVTGAALVGVMAAGGAGVAAAGLVGWEAGTWLGEREFVKNNLLKAMEALFPIDGEKPLINIKMPEWLGDTFTFEFNNSGEIIPIQFYVDAQGAEGVGYSGLWEGVDMWSDPWAAHDAAEKYNGNLVPELPTGAAAVVVGYQAAHGDIMLC